MFIRQYRPIACRSLVVVLLLGLMTFSVSGAAAAFKNIKIGDQALPIQLQDLDGQEHSLAQYKDAKAVLLVFWATWSQRSVQELGDLGEGVLITQVVPPPTERLLLPACEQYSRLSAKYYPQDKPNFVGFEGFINARILIEALRRTGRDISREGFIRALESIKEHYVGIGAVINFGPQDHQGMDDVYLTQVKDGHLQLMFYK